MLALQTVVPAFPAVRDRLGRLARRVRPVPHQGPVRPAVPAYTRSKSGELWLPRQTGLSRGTRTVSFSPFSPIRFEYLCAGISQQRDRNKGLSGKRGYNHRDTEAQRKRSVNNLLKLRFLCASVSLWLYPL